MLGLLWRLLRLPFIIESTALQQKRLKERRARDPSLLSDPDLLVDDVTMAPMRGKESVRHR